MYTGDNVSVLCLCSYRWAMHTGNNITITVQLFRVIVLTCAAAPCRQETVADPHVCSAADPCEECPCRNGGLCVRRGRKRKCMCKRGFHGRNCQGLCIGVTAVINTHNSSQLSIASLFTLISVCQTDWTAKIVMSNICFLCRRHLLLHKFLL